jgi:HD-GYP domain-containing protein (c-di-GMP phosphodiesterase class II)
MSSTKRSNPPLDLIAGLFVSAAAGGLAIVWSLMSSWVARPEDVILAAFLTLLLVVANRFPIHIRVASKIYMGSVVLFLMAALLPPALAATAAGAGLLAGELESRSRTGNPLSVVVGQAARWMLLVLLGSLLAHAAILPSRLHVLLLLPTAALLLLGDLLTVSLLLTPIVKEPWHRLVQAVAHEGIQAESTQYVLGVIGALMAQEYWWTLALLIVPTAFVYLAFKTGKEMHDETGRILENMADVVDLRDPYTGGHSRRVTKLVEATLASLGKQGPEVQLVVSAARVHDIGKIGMPDDVLRKTGKLTYDEWAVMKLHPEQGADLMKRYPGFSRGVEIIRHHHERWDGAGYPHRLGGTDIPFGARVVAVADSYDAMTSDRPYRPGMTPAHAVQLLREGRGVQWDPRIVDAFLESIADQIDEHPAQRLRVVGSPAGEQTA